MSRLVAILVALITVASNAATLRGTVFGPDEKPAQWALVEVVPMAPSWSTLERTKVEEGRFTVPLAPGAYRVRVYAPWLATTELAVWIASEKESVEVEVTLPRDRVLPARGAPLIRGDWTGFKKTDAMEPTADGKFVYRGNSSANVVRYYIERDTSWGPDRDPNRGEPRIEVAGHRFVSLADVRDGNFEIRFDPGLVVEREERDPARVRFVRRPDLQAAYEVDAAEQRFQEGMRYLRDVKGVARDHMTPEAEAFVKTRDGLLWKQVSRGPKLARQVAAAYLLRGVYDQAKRARLLALLPVTAPGWAASLPLTEEGSMLGPVLPPADAAKFIELTAHIASAHPDPAVRAVSLMGLASRAKEAGDEKLEARCLQQLKRAHSDADYVQAWMKRRDARPLALAVGMPFPATDVKTTAGAAIDASYFSAAKLTMVVFSAPGCGSCRMMLPSARALRKAYGPDVLRIVTFHAGMTPKLVAHDLEAEPQPWDHVALGEDEHPLEQACDIRGFPTVLLLGADGKVLNRDDGLWANLDRIVPNYLPRQN